MSARYSLELLNGRQAGEIYPLDVDDLLAGKDFVIGRSSECHLTLDGTVISRMHARISFQEGHFQLEDLASRNGTYHNGFKIQQPTILAHEDRIQLDHFMLRFIDAQQVSMPLGNFFHTSHGTGELPYDLTPSTIIDSYVVRLDMAQMNATNVARKFGAVLEFIRSLEVTLEHEVMFERMLDSILCIFSQALECSLYLTENQYQAEHKVLNSREPAIQRTRLNGEQLVHDPINDKIVVQVFDKSQGVISTESLAEYILDEEGVGLGSQSETVPVNNKSRIRTTMFAPVIGPSRLCLGILRVTSGIGERFMAADLDVLTSISFLLGQSAEYAELHKRQLQLQRRESDLMLAKDIQLHFLPQSLPVIPEYDFFSHYEAAEQIGGDYFDCILRPNSSQMAVTVGDVSGKGVPAALLMARLYADIRYYLATYDCCMEAISQLNRSLNIEVMRGRFMTFCLCQLDYVQHRLLIVNAGHVIPVIYRSQSREVFVQPLAKSGPPLGILRDWDYPCYECDFEPGDVIVLTTDGLTETMNEAGEMLGMKGIKEVVAEHGPQGASHLARELIKRQMQHGGHKQSTKDDLCLIVLSRHQTA